MRKENLGYFDVRLSFIFLQKEKLMPPRFIKTIREGPRRPGGIAVNSQQLPVRSQIIVNWKELAFDDA